MAIQNDQLYFVGRMADELTIINAASLTAAVNCLHKPLKDEQSGDGLVSKKKKNKGSFELF